MTEYDAVPTGIAVSTDRGNRLSMRATDSRATDIANTRLSACLRAGSKISRTGEERNVTETQLPSVLVVDDDSSDRAFLGEQLATAGYHVTTAANGLDALRRLQAEWAPIIIVDWLMPKMGGLELCRAIRAHEAIGFAYVIVVSADSAGDDHLFEAFQAGADDFLTKPYRVKELLARLGAGQRILKLHDELHRRTREVHRYNAEIEIVNRKLAVANERLKLLATRDELTGLWNRREALSRLSEAWGAAARHGHALSLMAMDIDGFKRINDTYGHAAGDAVLRDTALTLKANARRDEAVCRVGGEEFIIICSGSDEAQAAHGAERLRRAIETSVIEYAGQKFRVTISAGVAERMPQMNGSEALLRAADTALYAAKASGRNRVCRAGGVAAAQATLKTNVSIVRSHFEHQTVGG